MKKTYEKPELTVSHFAAENIITDSGVTQGIAHLKENDYTADAVDVSELFHFAE